MNQKRKEIAFWNEWSKTYDKHYMLNQKKSIVRLNRKANLVIQEAQINNNSKVLEVGCGTGVYTSMFAQMKADFTAIDISPQMIDVCKKKQILNEKKLIVMDAEQMDFYGDSFDTVIGCYILQWLQMSRFFHEVNRVLKPHGKLVLLAKNGKNPLTFIDQVIFTARYVLKDSVFSDIVLDDNIRKRLEFNGFINIKIIPIEFTYNRRINSILESIPIVKNITGSLLISAEKK
jgi:ubiquinone/menaquinone biosynthesis C-methylase UbiE